MSFASSHHLGVAMAGADPEKRRVPACEDADSISARLLELEAERKAARRGETGCVHEFTAMSPYCVKCGVSMPPTMAPEAGNEYG